MVDNNELNVEYRLTQVMLTDFFPKLLQGRFFYLFRNVIMGYQPLADILSEIPMKECVEKRKLSKITM